MNQLMIVRRGQMERFRSLQETFGRDPIRADIIWDRRQSERRRRNGSSQPDRRRRERRGPPPSTWHALDFLVVRSAASSGRTSAVAPAPEFPSEGDILIRREVGPRGPCTISKVPGPALSLCSSYDAALRQAEALAQQDRVDLWYTEDHLQFRLVRPGRRAASF